MQHKVGDDDVRFATDLPLRRVCFSTEVGPHPTFFVPVAAGQVTYAIWQPND
jgi:hypothetical protein